MYIQEFTLFSGVFRTVMLKPWLCSLMQMLKFDESALADHA